MNFIDIGRGDKLTMQRAGERRVGRGRNGGRVA